MDNELPSQLNAELHDTLHNTFRFKDFRQGQLAAISQLMQEGRLLCIQPTGHGKSILYQLPAVMLDGITLVLSPLLALMRDQLTQLTERFGIKAASINTDQSDEENYAAKQAAITGTIRILFIAPEQLDHVDKFAFLLRLPIQLLVVDEAHCISSWGHDFRPSYRQIIKLAHALVEKNPQIKLLGLTATANAKTEEDIKKQLTVDDKELVIQRSSMDRPNIRLSVINAVGMANKLATLIDLLGTLVGNGLIYCSTRENTEIVSEYLGKQGIIAAAYHAGIDTQRKRQIQHDFLHDKYTVVAATNALGMGIDKGNLRFIIHFDFPGSITAYYQEVGRCGRDGLPADGILLYDASDSKVQKYFIAAAQPTQQDFRHVLTAVAQAETLPNLMLLKRATGLHPTRLSVVLTELIEQNFIEKISHQRQQVYKLTTKMGQPDLVRYASQYAVRMHELEAMQEYAEQSKKCLMIILRVALGDEHTTACGRCSHCTTVPFQSIQDQDLVIATESWLNRRTVPITLNKKNQQVASGIAVLDGKLRSEDFVHFMKNRAKSSDTELGLADTLLQLMKSCLIDFSKYYQFSCIIPLPSRTWGAKNAIATLLGNYLKIPVCFDLLYWQDQPQVQSFARQGELLNNDQRQHNVSQRMRAQVPKKLPAGTVLLFDDYTGSGATLNEAARALREHAQVNNEILPFTIAAVKWRLGKSGMI